MQNDQDNQVEDTNTFTVETTILEDDGDFQLFVTHTKQNSRITHIVYTYVEQGRDAYAFEFRNGDPEEITIKTLRPFVYLHRTEHVTGDLREFDTLSDEPALFAVTRFVMSTLPEGRLPV
jgi:hypothetical protein